MSSICLNIPAAGLGSRPPSIISTDEGGFNEPSPEIKAKLKPSYTFDPSELEAITHSPPLPDELPPIPLHHTNTLLQQSSASSSVLPSQFVAQSVLDTSSSNEHSLHYVDFGYRLNPDGSETRPVYGESDLYSSPTTKSPILLAEQQLLQQQERIKAQYRTPLANGFGGSKESSVLYATIKPEVPPPSDLFLECSANGYDATSTTEKIYHSPQTILDPTRSNFNEELNPPHPPMSSFGQLPEPPPRPPLPEGPPLDLDGVEFADAEEADEPLSSDRVDFLADAVMTADEEERLLSAR